MLKSTECKVRSCLSTHRREIVGAIFLILATLLTLLTLSGVGILGMFIVGLVLCSHKHLCCRNSDSSEEVKKPAPKKAPAVKKEPKSN
ncbi:MAG: hypothetical protein P1U74_01235 [Legionellaceae bacterium]|nr:hypothetical protein [Legionellaceae bacterium]